MFAMDGDDCGRTDTVYRRIETGEARPIRQPTRLPLAKQTAVDDTVYDMQRRGIIEESSRSWSSSVVCIRKKNGGLRFCVDYKKLNNVRKKDYFPLPRIDETLDMLGGGNCYPLST
jgi:hypothetical protein